MRLTLRTMLAYLDEILEQEDQAEIGRKIEESEFASDLARRTRDVIGKLRLGAPVLSGRGVDIDPNMVAEYLDNSLAAERVTDFERACLESDVCLAEVAACHQILTLVLGQPAEVDAGTRARIYSLGASDVPQEQASPEPDTEPLPPAPVAPTTVAAVTADDGHRRRRRPEIPDYLRESNRSVAWRFVAAAALITIVLGAATLIFVGPKKIAAILTRSSDQVAQQTGEDAGDPDVVAGGDAADSATAAPESRAAGQPTPGAQLDQPAAIAAPSASDPLAPAPANIPDPEGRTEGPNPPPADERGPDPTTDEVVGSATEAPLAGSDTGVPPSVDATPWPGGVPDDVQDEGSPPIPPPESGVEPPVSDQEIPPADMPPEGDTAPDAGTGDIGTPRPDIETGTKDTPDAAATNGSGTPEDTVETGDPPAANGLVPEGGVAAESPSQPEMGIYSNGEALLSFDEALSQWRRLPLRAVVRAGERLLALPSFHSQLTLTSGSGVTLDMVGPASLRLQKDDPNEGPSVALLYGRALLLNVGQADNRLGFWIGDQQCLVTFGDVGTTLAIEVSRHRAPGTDPEMVPAPAVANIYATSGQLQWQIAAGGGATAMVAPGQWRLADGRLEPVADAGPPPDWINAGGPDGLELRAAKAVAAELSDVPERPVTQVLQELVEGQRSGRRSEVRSLAARCAVHVGKFEPFVEALNDPEQKTWRSRLIESLEEALALGPDVAAAIRQAFVRRHGDETGMELYRLLQGFDGEDLKRGADRQLVDYLHHDQLDFRLLALWNLIRVTGIGQTARLQDPKASRFQVARRWELRLEDDEIVPPDEPR